MQYSYCSTVLFLISSIQLPFRADKVTGVSVRMFLKIILMFFLCVPEI